MADKYMNGCSTSHSKTMQTKALRYHMRIAKKKNFKTVTSSSIEHCTEVSLVVYYQKRKKPGNNLSIRDG